MNSCPGWAGPQPISSPARREALGAHGACPGNARSPPACRSLSLVGSQCVRIGVWGGVWAKQGKHGHGHGETCVCVCVDVGVMCTRGE